MIKRLSILDMAPVDQHSSGKQALHNTITLARKADQLGYFRYWVTEHHNIPSVASAAPEILIAQIAAQTQNIRVGSGGIMLPNHSPLKVAENFKLLETFHANRIDMGIGRAPGTDGKTALAIRRTQPNPYAGDEFKELLYELRGYESTLNRSEVHPFPDVIAMPEGVALPPIWILGSSMYSAHLAAREDLNYVFAHNFNPSGTKDAINQYRKLYQDVHSKEAPAAIVGISILGGETADEVEYQKNTLAMKYIKGLGIPNLPPVEQLDFNRLPEQLQQMGRSYLATQVIGTWSELKQKLDHLSHDLKVEELMISTVQEGFESRMQLYEVLADRYNLK